MGDEKEDRWNVAQSTEEAFWKRSGVLDTEMKRVLCRYAAVIGEISKTLCPNPKILDVGCGPTCAGRLFRVGSKTYLDPLMDSYVKIYPDRLPDGEKLCATAEAIPKQDECFDVVISVNALDHMIDPIKVLSEIKRVLKKDGIFALGIFLHPPPIAFSRKIIERFLPVFREEAHPYSYTVESIRELLKTAFLIQSETRVFRKDSALAPSLHREDWMFVCKKGGSEGAIPSV